MNAWKEKTEDEENIVGEVMGLRGDGGSGGNARWGVGCTVREVRVDGEI